MLKFYCGNFFEIKSGLNSLQKRKFIFRSTFFVLTTDLPAKVKSKSSTSESLQTFIKSKHYNDIKFKIKLGDFNNVFKDNI